MNFNVWKKQMMCLVESQDVVGFINGEIVEPQQSEEQKLWIRSDSLVQGWILGSIGTDVLPKVCCLKTAREVWLELEKIFNGDKTSVSEIQPSEELNTSNFHQLTMDCTNEKYSSLTSINVANFVTVRPQLTDEVKLRSNFTLWREQMLCLLKSQDVVDFINGETKEPQSDEQKLWRRIDSLVKGWILGSIGADVLQYVCVLETAQEVWFELGYIFKYAFSADKYNELVTSNDLWPSSVNVAKFVTVRPQLTEEERSTDFNTWKKQMLCLLMSQDVVGFIEGKMVEPQQADERNLWRITDRLVKGWILGSIGTDVLQEVCYLKTARKIWLKLKKIFHDEEIDSNSTTDQDFETASQVSTDYRKYLPLYDAALRGDWKKAKHYFEENKDVTTDSFITEDKETTLHVAVRIKETGNGFFVQKLVEMMEPEALAIENINGKTALHEAAIVGNTKAAKVMVEKLKVVNFMDEEIQKLLCMTDNEGSMAIDYTVENDQKETLVYLISVSNPDMENGPFKGERGLYLLTGIIYREFMDVALDVVKVYPDLARSTDCEDNTYCALSVLAGTDSAFKSSENLRWWEKLINRCIPEEQSESMPKSGAGDIEATTCRCSFSAGKQCKSMIWKVIEHLVPGVKGIKDKKKLRSQAVELVNLLCSEIEKLPTKDARVMLQDSIMRAAKYGIKEIVEVIMEKYPAYTTCVNKEGWTIMHMAVKWRFENVVKLIHKMKDRKHKFCDIRDNKGNSLLHLCAMRPHPDILNNVPGAALQMQHELQWFDELEKFVPLSCKVAKNSDRKTAKELFIEEHRELKAEGEKWMKDTANACSIATALIATVVFAATFTVPGGVSSETGIAVFFEEPAFVFSPLQMQFHCSLPLLHFCCSSRS